MSMCEGFEEGMKDVKREERRAVEKIRAQGRTRQEKEGDKARRGRERIEVISLFFSFSFFLRLLLLLSCLLKSQRGRCATTEVLLETAGSVVETDDDLTAEDDGDDISTFLHY